MATIARLGHGTVLTFSTFAGEITSLDVSAEKESIDVTHMLSPGQYREFIGGLKDPGELSLELNLDPSEADPMTLGEDSLTITWPDGSTWTWPSAECTAYNASAPVGEQMTASATWKLSGEKVQA